MGNGAGGNGRLFEGASVLTKIVVGVMIAMIVSGLAFGVRVYAFMNAGDRFTSSDGRDLEARMFLYVEEHYVREETLDARFLAIQRQLDRIEKKMDEALARP